jgi:hypothetical protein
MKILKRSAVLLLLVASQLTVFAQYELAISVRGLNCSTNAGRQVLSKPITEQTLLADGAANQGIADLSSVALVYHEQGPGYDSTSADSIDLVNASTGAPIFTLFGLFFGDSTNLNRVAITNAANTMVKRVDYIYTTQNSHSMGAAFVTKRFLRDGNGHTRPIIEGQMQWIINPVATNGTQVCRATFCTKKIRY